MSDQSFCTYGELTVMSNEAKQYPGVMSFSVGRSILGREIPAFVLGEGKKAVVLLGGVLGTEGLTAALLFDFIKDYSEQLQKSAKIYEISMPYLFAERRIVVVPYVNPDGIGYASEGVSQDNPLYERVLRMNGGADFHAWQANARGVTLSRNFSAGFAEAKGEERAAAVPCGAPFGFGGEYPESEPESAALVRLLRALGEDLQGGIVWHLNGGVSCSCRDKLSAKTMAAGRILCRVMGSREPSPRILAPLGSPADFCIEVLSRPAFHVGVDLSNGHARALLYERLRRALFTFPFML